MTPRILPDCGHTLCTKCLSDLINKADEIGEEFACPEDRTVCSVKKPADEFPKNFSLLSILEKKAEKVQTEASGDPMMCPQHNRKVELICLEHKVRICTSCALFGDPGSHKGCPFRPDDDVMEEIVSRTELLMEVFELVANSISNFSDTSEIDHLYNEFSKKQVTLKKQVADTFKNIIAELKKKEERTMDILDSNFNKIDKMFTEVRDTPKTIMTEAEVWIEKVQEMLDSFTNKTSEDPNYIAFELMENSDHEQDVIRIGENILEQFHNYPSTQNPTIRESIVGLIEQLQVEFDDHFKNRITMLCHVSRLDVAKKEAQKESPKMGHALSESSKPNQKKPESHSMSSKAQTMDSLIDDEDLSKDLLLSSEESNNPMTYVV